MSTPTRSRLSRRLGLGDAVVIGLGSMIGAGVFAAIGPAAAAAGHGTAHGPGDRRRQSRTATPPRPPTLAAVYPASGGTYVYGRERLGPFWGYLAGWGFVVGKTASCAAMALTVGAYAAPSWQRPIAVAAVVGLTAVNYLGDPQDRCRSPASSSWSSSPRSRSSSSEHLFGGQASADHFGGLTVGGWRGILQSAGTAVLRVRRLRPDRHPRRRGRRSGPHDPEGNPPRARHHARRLSRRRPRALAAVGPAALARSRAPRSPPRCAPATSTRSSPAVRIGGTIAALGVLLRSSPASAAPRSPWPPTASSHGGSTPSTRRTRSRTALKLAVGVLIAALVAFTDLRGAIGFSSFCVLTYYAIANASAWTLPPDQRRWPRVLSAAGVAGCITVAFTLPLSNVLTGVAVLGAGAAIWTTRHLRSH